VCRARRLGVDVVGESGGGGVAVPDPPGADRYDSAGYEAGLAYYPTPVPVPV